MGQHFNKKAMEGIRRRLRRNMTYCERIIWLHLRKKQLKVRFHRQYSIDNYVLDFYCPKIRLAIEVDGDVHNSTRQKKYDIERQRYIERYGIKFLRITNSELLENPNKIFAKIENEINIFPAK